MVAFEVVVDNEALELFRSRAPVEMLRDDVWFDVGGVALDDVYRAIGEGHAFGMAESGGVLVPGNHCATRVRFKF